MKKVNLGQTISILANVGVIAGIVFLGYEMRQNTAALRSQAAQGILEQIASNSGYLIEDESLIDIFHRGDADPTNLTPIEMQRYNSFRDLNFQSWQNMYIQVQEGALDEAVVEGWWQLLTNVFEDPGVRFYWERRKFLLSKAFQAFIENEILALEPTQDGARS